MRRRQTCCMHGGYRGAGVTINWNTTSTNGMPIVEPTPSNPEPIDNKNPIKPDSKASRIGEIVGLTVSGLGAATLAGLGAYTYYKNSRGIGDNGIIEEGERVPLLSGNKKASRRRDFGISLSEEEQERWGADDPDPELQLDPDPRQALKDIRQECADAECLRGLSSLFNRV